MDRLISRCATGSASAELPANVNPKLHWQNQWHTISTGCQKHDFKPGIPFNATPRADASNSDSPGQNSLHRVLLLRTEAETPILRESVVAISPGGPFAAGSS
jgi:hypothetical protein